MKSTITVFMLALALLLSGCGGAANNTAPANNNPARNAPAVPTVDALTALEKQAHEAYLKGDGQFFQTFLSDKFSMLGDKGEHHGKTDMVKMIGTVKCEGAKVDLSEPQMAKIDNDTYVVVTKATYEGSCMEGGKSMKLPSPMRSASIYVRHQGDKWMGAWHGETPIMGASPAADKAGDAKKEEPKKSEAKPAEAKKPEDAKASDADAAPASKMAKNADPKSAAPRAEDDKPAKVADPNSATDTMNSVKSANSDALTKLHTAGWEAYGKRDAAKLEAMTAANLTFVSPEGKFFANKADVIKEWTAAKCDIKSTSVADGWSTAFSATAELLFTKGTADGTCDGPDGKPMKLGSLWGAAVYVKEGNDWKLAFLWESPA